MSRTRSVLSTPGFVADPNSLRHDTGRQIDWDAVSDKFRLGAVAVTLTAGAAQGAVSITVAALSGAVAPGAVLRFSADEFATVGPAGAAAGATAVPVEALVNALETGDTAYTGGSGAKHLPAGTIVALPAGGKAVPAVDNTAKGVLISAADEPTGSARGVRTDALTGYGVLIGGHLYENLLPDADSGTGQIPAAAKTALGSLFTWQKLVDTRLP